MLKNLPVTGPIYLTYINTHCQSRTLKKLRLFDLSFFITFADSFCDFYIYIYIGLDLLMRDFLKFLWGFSSDGPRCCWPNCSRKAPVVVVVVVLRPLWDMVGNFQSMDGTLEPNISFKFVPISRPHPSATTHSHPCPPMLFKLRPCVQKLYHYQ